VLLVQHLVNTCRSSECRHSFYFKMWLHHNDYQHLVNKILYIVDPFCHEMVNKSTFVDFYIKQKKMKKRLRTLENLGSCISESTYLHCMILKLNHRKIPYCVERKMIVLLQIPNTFTETLKIWTISFQHRFDIETTSFKISRFL